MTDAVGQRYSTLTQSKYVQTVNLTRLAANIDGFVPVYSL